MRELAHWEVEKALNSEARVTSVRVPKEIIEWCKDNNITLRRLIEVGFRSLWYWRQTEDLKHAIEQATDRILSELSDRLATYQDVVRD